LEKGILLTPLPGDTRDIYKVDASESEVVRTKRGQLARLSFNLRIPFVFFSARCFQGVKFPSVPIVARNAHTFGDSGKIQGANLNNGSGLLLRHRRHLHHQLCAVSILRAAWWRQGHTIERIAAYRGAGAWSGFRFAFQP